MVENWTTHPERSVGQVAIRFSEGNFTYPAEMSVSDLADHLNRGHLLFKCEELTVILQTEEIGSDLYLNILNPNDRELIGYQKVTISGEEAKNMYKRYSSKENLETYGSQGLFRASLSIFCESLKARGIKMLSGRIRLSNEASLKSRQQVPKLFEPNSYYRSELKDTYSEHEKELFTYLD